MMALRVYKRLPYS